MSTQFWFGGRVMVSVSDPDAARKIASRCIARPDISWLDMLHGKPREVMGSGLLTLKGAQWRLARHAFEAAIVHPK